MNFYILKFDKVIAFYTKYNLYIYILERTVCFFEFVGAFLRKNLLEYWLSKKEHLYLEKYLPDQYRRRLESSRRLYVFRMEFTNNSIYDIEV